MKKTAFFLFFFLLLLFAGCNAQTSNPAGTELAPEGTLTVHFISVGQGDAILLQEGTNGFLIDSGESSAADIVLEYLEDQGIETLDYVVGTHPHEDHIGSLAAVISAYPVGVILMPEVAHSTATYEGLLDTIIDQGLTVTAPEPGTELVWGDVVIEILAPLKTYDSLNNDSIVLKVIHGENSFLFTGDIEAEAEGDLLSSDLRADVLKVAHHGSATSTSAEFLAAVSPSYGVISVGEGNDYGHPSEDTLERLAAADVEIYRTDLSGAVVFTSDGAALSITGAPYEAAAPTTGYIGNQKSLVFHREDCANLPEEQNRVYFQSRQEAIAAGYRPCGNCKP